jgi:N-dimethylarginine dimethylaminohydrolase
MAGSLVTAGLATSPGISRGDVMQASFADSDGGIQLIPGYRHKLTRAPIGEWNLWGSLREVIVGTPEGTIVPKFDAFIENAVAPDLAKLAKAHEGKLLKDALPDFYAALDIESRTLAAVYESHGVKVHIPRPITPAEAAYAFGYGSSTAFPCDVFWCVGRNVIESTWRRMYVPPLRWTVRELIQPHVDADPSVFLHACPLPNPETQDYIFECSDILIVGDGNVILAYDSHRKSSNARGCEWAKRILEADGFKVTVIELLDVGIVHLFAVICIIGPGVAIACEDAFPGRRLPDPLKGWKVVWCSLDEARETAACTVNIDRKTVILPKGAPRVCEAVSKLGFEVVDIEFSAHAQTGGGIRCATAVVHREIDG